ncbi:MAG TPA: sugar-binding protein, partial [Sedimentisphaerales bacterium]|nr:sugar-binding protein [Sedimentisphaerales bacterium]
MCKKLIYLVSVFMVVGLIGPVAAQEVDMEIPFVAQPPVIDGEVDEIWADASTQSFVPLDDPANASGIWKVLYDSENLYVIV